MQTIEGWTSAMICCISDSINCLEIILEFGGCNLNLKDNDNRNALDLAILNKSKKCFLKLNGLELNKFLLINKEEI
jgi:ankyrin repeat protein